MTIAILLHYLPKPSPIKPSCVYLPCIAWFKGVTLLEVAGKQVNREREGFMKQCESSLLVY